MDISYLNVGGHLHYLCSIPDGYETNRPTAKMEEAERLVERHVDYHNHVRLHGATDYITPEDMFEGREESI